MKEDEIEREKERHLGTPSRKKEKWLSHGGEKRVSEGRCQR